jgi:rRNA biogenesis protein RRP5
MTVFKHWAVWEESKANKKGVERVKALQQQWKEARESKDEE